MTRNNHYTPCFYLKRFTAQDGRLSVYRTLVPNTSFPDWRLYSPRSVGYLAHLYTRLAAGQETDEIEMWLKQEFEDPAVVALEKATSGAQLTRGDWKLLIKFLAAQTVRTPAHFIKNLPRWKKDVPALLNSTLQEVVEYAKNAARLGITATLPASRHPDPPIPIRLDRYVDPTGPTRHIKASVIVGRGLWHFQMRSILDGSAAEMLHEHKWSILAPHGDLTWFTSDDPVTMLNYYEREKYDFDGGSGRKGTQIFFPLSPHHLMYTQIGDQPPRYGHEMSREITLIFRRMIAEHAHRMIFAQTPDLGVPVLRPRIVNVAQFVEETRAWEKWHEEQTRAESGLVSPAHRHK